MDKNEENKLGELIDRVMDETPLESPSSHFTANVISQIVASELSVSTQYKPLIPKSVLIFLCAGLVVMTWYLSTGYDLDNETWFGNGQVDLFFEKILDWPQLLISSKTTLYAVLLFGLLFLIQIPWLKKYFDNNWMLN